MVGKQVPFGNDSKKGNGKRRFPSGMTTREARAKQGRQEQTRIPFGNDNKKGKGTTRKARATQIPFGNDNKRGYGKTREARETQVPFGKDSKEGGMRGSSASLRITAQNSDFSYTGADGLEAAGVL